MLKDGFGRFGESKLLYLDYLFYSFEALRTYPYLYFFIKSFKNKYQNDLSLNIEFCLFQLTLKLKRYLIQKNFNSNISNKLKIENVKKFDKGMSIAKEGVMLVNTNFYKMWESLGESIPDLARISNICHISIKAINQMNSHYEYLNSLNDHSVELKNLMDIYTNFIIFDDILSAEVSKNHKIISKMEIGNSQNKSNLDMVIENYNIFDENTGTISISNDFETLGY